MQTTRALNSKNLVVTAAQNLNLNTNFEIKTGENSHRSGLNSRINSPSHDSSATMVESSMPKADLTFHKISKAPVVAQNQNYIEQLNFMGNKKFTRAMITPEIAAFVVKEYLLPMFESDGKRLLAKKHKNKMD